VNKFRFEGQLEKGTFYASLKIIGRLAEALGVEPAEFLKLPPGSGSRDRGATTKAAR
jgi:hypothetical protein